MSLPQRIEHPPPDVISTVAMLREFSRQTDPQNLVNSFSERVPHPDEGRYWLSLSRRELSPPWYRITRHTLWPDDHDPWRMRDKLPLFDRGLLGELIHGNLPAIVNDVRAAMGNGDPGRPFLEGVGSILALPQYDQGTSLNMIIRITPEPGRFSWTRVPDFLSFANVLGKAVSNLVLSKKLEKAYADLDYQFSIVGEIQKSLLPPAVPQVAGLEIGVGYRTATRAGGDYYDFFSLSPQRMAFLIADVGGHGPIAAVVMAIMRTMLHASSTDREHPAKVLEFLNRGLLESGQGRGFRFTTAFFAVYDTESRVLRYASAGHCPPLWDRIGRGVVDLDAAQRFPLGVEKNESYVEAEIVMKSGDALLLYTDGVTEAANSSGEMFGDARIRSHLLRRGDSNPQAIVQSIEEAVNRHRGAGTVEDDVTLLCIRF